MPAKRMAQRAFTLIELVVVIVVIALLLGLAAFGYTRFIAGAKTTAVQGLAVQIGKAIQGHSAAHQLPYGPDTYDHAAITGIVGADLPASTTFTGMVTSNDPDTGQGISTVTVTHPTPEHTARVSFRTGDIGTGPLTAAAAADGSPPPAGGFTAPTGVTVDQPRGDTAVLSWTGPPGATSYTVATGDTTLWTGPGTSATLDTLPEGTYTVTVTATNGEDTSPASAPVTFTIHCWNDPVSCAWPIPTMPTDTSWTSGDVDNTGAGREEDGDPTSSYRANLWWSFTAPARGTYTFQTRQPLAGTATTLPRLAVYRDNDGAASGAVGSTTNSEGVPVAKFLDAGAKVLVVVGHSTSGSPGRFRLQVTRSPENDSWATPAETTVLAPETEWRSDPVTSRNAGRDEPGDPTASYGHNLWWRFTAPGAGTYTFDTPVPADGAVVKPRLAVYRDTAGSVGSGVGDTTNSIDAPLAVFLADGQQVLITVGDSTSGGVPGAFRLRIRRGPANDSWTTPAPVPSLAAGESWTSADVTNVGAGANEPGDPTTSYGHTVWWSFTAPATATYSFGTAMPSSGTPIGLPRLAVYKTSGEKPATTHIAESETSFATPASVPLTEGTRVLLVVGDAKSGGHAGRFRLTASRSE